MYIYIYISYRIWVKLYDSEIKNPLLQCEHLDPMLGTPRHEVVPIQARAVSFLQTSAGSIMKWVYFWPWTSSKWKHSWSSKWCSHGTITDLKLWDKALLHSSDQCGIAYRHSLTGHRTSSMARMPGTCRDGKAGTWQRDKDGLMVSRYLKYWG